MARTIVGCGVVRRVYIQNSKVCSKNEAAAPTPPQNDEFSIKWHIIQNSFLFLSKNFEILDFDPPNNPTSHYGACHFGYNLALIIFLLHPRLYRLK